MSTDPFNASQDGCCWEQTLPTTKYTNMILIWSDCNWANPLPSRRVSYWVNNNCVLWRTLVVFRFNLRERDEGPTHLESCRAKGRLPQAKLALIVLLLLLLKFQHPTFRLYGLESAQELLLWKSLPDMISSSHSQRRGRKRRLVFWPVIKEMINWQTGCIQAETQNLTDTVGCKADWHRAPEPIHH